MTGSERRKHIVDRIRQSQKPVSGTVLARECQVSRQVIVQDIALIRAAGHDILSTHRGYRLQERRQASRVFQVRHTDAQIEEELFTIVDLGGSVKNVMVDHQVYGQHLSGGDPQREIQPAQTSYLGLSLPSDPGRPRGYAGSDPRGAARKGVPDFGFRGRGSWKYAL